MLGEVRHVVGVAVYLGVDDLELVGSRVAEVLGQGRVGVEEAIEERGIRVLGGLGLGAGG